MAVLLSCCYMLYVTLLLPFCRSYRASYQQPPNCHRERDLKSQDSGLLKPTRAHQYQEISGTVSQRLSIEDLSRQERASGDIRKLSNAASRNPSFQSGILESQTSASQSSEAGQVSRIMELSTMLCSDSHTLIRSRRYYHC